MFQANNLSKSFTSPEGSHPVLRDCSLEIQEGEFVALVGPSGCGKTTLLRVLAGLDRVERGEIYLDGVRVTRPGQSIGCVFQHPTYLPWKTVEENVAFGLELAGRTSDEERIKRVTGILKEVELSEVRTASSETLSGGMQQRLVLAQTLIQQPRVLLLDEPFASLDHFTRQRMQDFLARLHEREQKMTLCITHDLEEALFLADRILVMDQMSGKIQAEVLVNFARPRTPDLRHSLEFFNEKRALEKLVARVFQTTSLS